VQQILALRQVSCVDAANTEDKFEHLSPKTDRSCHAFSDLNRSVQVFICSGLYRDAGICIKLGYQK
jgi:hypothetical protein